MNIKYPAFFNDIPTIKIYDPLAEFLGSIDGGIIEYNYLDAVKLAGHSCPTVASAYWMTCKAMKALYGEDLPERGNIRVDFHQKNTDGVCGVIANVTSLITGAGNDTAFKGIGGRFDRRKNLMFESGNLDETRFTRLDTMQAVGVEVNLQGILFSPRVLELLPKCLNGTASSEDKTEFGELWQLRVKEIILNHADDKDVFNVTPI